MEEARLVHPALGHQKMEVGVKIDPGSEGLNGGNNSGHQLAPGCHLEITGHRPEGAAAELPQQPAIVLKEDAQHLRDGEDDLAVGDIQEKLPLHPLAPLLKPLRMARRAEAAGAAGEHQEAFRMAVRTADAGKATARVAAVEVALDHLLYQAKQYRFSDSLPSV